jgi:uncharacterized protein YlxW (UPF0749 family)
MNKRLTAFLAAAISTACIGVAILAVGGAALFNPNGTAVAQSPAQAAALSSGSSSQAQVQQLQSLVAQYQQREQQYQQREQQLEKQIADQNSQVQQAQQQMQEVRSLLMALQQRGLITVTDEGRIFINR